MSSPLPCWSSTRPMIASATSTCIPITMLIHISIDSAFPLRGTHDGDEVIRHQRRAADQSAVHVRHAKQRRRIVLLHATAVEDACACRNLAAQERMHFLHLLR